jgi:hypothetical protein
MIVFIPRSGAGCNPAPADSEWLPRQCPACEAIAVIGHGRRRRQAHDGLHEEILVRRGICKLCRRTLTVLPQGCVPGAVYTLLARQQAMAAVAEGLTVEEAAPHCRDPDRIPDASTIRRWLWRRLQSLRFWWAAPTLLAWDRRAATRILLVETRSP